MCSSSRPRPPISSRKAAHGIADDMVSTTLLATKAPVVIAPAMNTGMYDNPVTQQNLEHPARAGLPHHRPGRGAPRLRRHRPRQAAGHADAAARHRAGDHAAGPQGSARAGHRRPDAGGARSGALLVQPLDGQDGLRHCGTRGDARRGCDAGLRPDRAGNATSACSAWISSPRATCTTR